MKRVNIFLAILIATITALIAATIVGFSVFSNSQTSQNPSGWMSQMWGGTGGMMGRTGTTAQAAASPLLPYFGVLFAVLISVTVIGIVGMTYYLLYPQMKMGTVNPIQSVTNQKTVNTAAAYESVAKTLTEEERKIIQVLNAHEGKYLQKYIRSETGLSRLKTHRIIARLAERGIVTLEKTGNTNQVYLANWLTQEH